MHELYELKEMLMKELEEYGQKGELTSGSLEVVDKLSHAIKNLCKIIETYEEEEEMYSMAGGSSYRGGSSYDGGESGQSRRGGQGGGSSRRGGGSSYRGGSSYARGRGRNARRDSMGRYSSEGGYSMAGGEMVEELRELMQDAPDNQTRMEFEKFIRKLEQM